MKKLNNNRVFNIVAALLVAVSLMCGNAVQVRAYTDINGYPFVLNGVFYSNVYGSDYSSVVGTLHEQNSYFFDFSTSVDNVYEIRFGDYSQSLIIPFNLDVYDYYVVGTVGFDGVTDYPGIKDGVFLSYEQNLNNYNFLSIDNFVTMDFNSGTKLVGNSFYGKINSSNLMYVSNLSFFILSFDNFTFDGNIWFSASIVPVAKGTEAEQLNQAILNELVKINQNLITANTLQQQTIDAIKDHDTNVGNWFTTLTSNLGNWFQNLYTSMGVGFEKLYQQMTKEQDEQLHGYQDTTTSEAANAFSSESDKLTALEGDLSNQSNQYVSDFTAQGFDLGVLATIGSSLVFVTTWFTNFWNMGGIWTAGLNLCFALSIVFFILRFKR